MGVALGVADEVEKQVRALVPAESLRSPMRGAPTGLAGITAFRTVHAAAPGLVLVVDERRQRVHERLRLLELLQRLLERRVLRGRRRRRRRHRRGSRLSVQAAAG